MRIGFVLLIFVVYGVILSKIANYLGSIFKFTEVFTAIFKFFQKLFQKSGDII